MQDIYYKHIFVEKLVYCTFKRITDVKYNVTDNIINIVDNLMFEYFRNLCEIYIRAKCKYFLTLPMWLMLANDK